MTRKKDIKFLVSTTMFTLRQFFGDDFTYLSLRPTQLKIHKFWAPVALLSYEKSSLFL